MKSEAKIHLQGIYTEIQKAALHLDRGYVKWSPQELRDEELGRDLNALRLSLTAALGRCQTCIDVCRDIERRY